MNITNKTIVYFFNFLKKNKLENDLFEEIETFSSNASHSALIEGLNYEKFIISLSSIVNQDELECMVKEKFYYISEKLKGSPLGFNDLLTSEEENEVKQFREFISNVISLQILTSLWEYKNQQVLNNLDLLAVPHFNYLHHLITLKIEAINEASAAFNSGEYNNYRADYIYNIFNQSRTLLEDIIPLSMSSDDFYKKYESISNEEKTGLKILMEDRFLKSIFMKEGAMDYYKSIKYGYLNLFVDPLETLNREEFHLYIENALKNIEDSELQQEIPKEIEQAIDVINKKSLDNTNFFNNFAVSPETLKHFKEELSGDESVLILKNVVIENGKLEINENLRILPSIVKLTMDPIKKVEIKTLFSNLFHFSKYRYDDLYALEPEVLEVYNKLTDKIIRETCNDISNMFENENRDIISKIFGIDVGDGGSMFESVATLLKFGVGTAKFITHKHLLVDGEYFKVDPSANIFLQDYKNQFDKFLSLNMNDEEVESEFYSHLLQTVLFDIKKSNFQSISFVKFLIIITIFTKCKDTRITILDTVSEKELDVTDTYVSTLSSFLIRSSFIRYLISFKEPKCKLSLQSLKRLKIKNKFINNRLLQLFSQNNQLLHVRGEFKNRFAKHFPEYIDLWPVYFPEAILYDGNLLNIYIDASHIMAKEISKTTEFKPFSLTFEESCFVLVVAIKFKCSQEEACMILYNLQKIFDESMGMVEFTQLINNFQFIMDLSKKLSNNPNINNPKSGVKML